MNQLKPLTEREYEVSYLVYLGLNNREIAKKLYISERTTELHIFRSCKKFGCKNRQGFIK